MRSRWLCCPILALWGLSCSAAPEPRCAAAPSVLAEDAPRAPTPVLEVGSPEGSAEHPANAAPATIDAALPAGVLPGLTAEVPVPADRSVRVVHGGPRTRRALVYLHGMCGNPEAMDDWSSLASHYGTLVVLRADVPCGDRPGSKWPQDVGAIQARIDRALDAVAEQRGGLLDRERLVLIGYSQGAHRGERLAEAFPERYPYLILGGPPGTANPERLARARAVAILGGERENTEHMRDGANALLGAGLRARFFLLPRVGHGGYGPEAPRVLGEVFSWLFSEPDPE